MAQLPVLVTSKYCPVGAYIGQIIRPRAGTAVGDARYPALIGKGSRLALGKNLGIYRAFVYAETLSFTATAPFTAVLTYQANGAKDSPVRLYKTDGTVVRNDQWVFTTSGLTANKAIVINTEAFDQNATYKMDYQSNNRAVLDPLPVDDLREVKTVGDTEDQPQYEEYVDYVIRTSVTAPTAASTNTYITRTLEAPAVISVVGTGTVVQDASSIYLHNYNRYYTVKCLSTGGVAPTRTATFEWRAIPISSGNSLIPPVPLHTSETAPQFSLVEATPSTLTQTLEQGIKLTFAFGGVHYQANDEWGFNALGAGLVEKEDRYANTNQYTEAGTVTIANDAGGATGTGTMSVSVANYASSYNTNFKVKCISKAGGVGTYTATFVWAMYGDTQPFANGTFTMVQATSTLTFSLAQGISITCAPGASNYNVSDSLSFKVYAPKIYYQGKDNRTIVLTVSAATATSLKAVVAGSYTTDTIEGSFGTFSATAEYGSTTNLGLFQLGDNLIFKVRNVYRYGLPASSRIVAADKFTIAATNDGTIDWSLSAVGSDARTTSEVYQDVNGTITGTAGTYYTILSNTPTAGTVSVSPSVSFTEISDTPYISFVSMPTATLTFTYKYKGEEPTPGQIYFLTATYLRPDDLYDTPTFVGDKDSGRDLLAPSTSENHLYIANEIAWEHNVSGVYIIQVKDEDGDGVYTNADYQRAILSTEETDKITDRIVLSNWGTISTQLSVNVKANDPFEKRESIDWFGVPVNTSIGDDTTSGTIRYYARNTLQVYGNSPAHGTRVLHGSTYCKKTITLDSGTTQQVTLDGSFISVALASITSSFTDPASTILHKTLTGFDEVEVYSESDNVLLGSSSVIFFEDQGSGVYLIKEDLTVDTLAPEYQLISGTVQRHNTVKLVRTAMNALTATVVVSGQAGVNLTRSQLGGTLLTLVSRGLIAPYQDDNGNERKFDPGTDVIVFQDSGDPTLYHFLFCFYCKWPIKRTFGLYSVGSNDFSAGIVAQ